MIFYDSHKGVPVQVGQHFDIIIIKQKVMNTGKQMNCKEAEDDTPDKI